MVFKSEVSKIESIRKWKLWSSIELHIFRLCDVGRMVTTMISMTIPLLVLAMSDVHVELVQYESVVT